MGLGGVVCGGAEGRTIGVEGLVGAVPTVGFAGEGVVGVGGAFVVAVDLVGALLANALLFLYLCCDLEFGMEV